MRGQRVERRYAPPTSPSEGRAPADHGDDLSTDDEGLLAVLAGLRRNLGLLLLVAVPVLLGVVAYAETRPAVYRAESTLSFTPRLGTSVGADVIRLVLPRYVAYLAAPATVARVANATGEDPEQLTGAADASIQTDTANLTITVTLGDGGRAADAANALADAALSYARGDDLLEAQLVARAQPSTTPTGPPRRLLEIAGLLAALLSGVAAALARERLRPRVLTAADLERLVDAPLLGVLPASAQLARGETVEVSDPLLGPAVRGTWLQVERAVRDQPVRSLAITSPSSNDGKTTVATALAAAAARTGRTVVLLDADTQQAGLTVALGPFKGPMLSRALDGASVEETLHEGPVEGLRVLPTDVSPADVSGLRRALPDLVLRLHDSCDLLVLDCAPVQDEDARSTVSLADGVLLVVTAGTARQAVVDALAVLRSLELRVVGVVLNAAKAAARPTGYQRPSLVEGGS